VRESKSAAAAGLNPPTACTGGAVNASRKCVTRSVSADQADGVAAGVAGALSAFWYNDR
jgi:hypothetical protein